MERVLGVWVGDKLNMSQHNQKGKWCSGCIKYSIVSQSKMIVLLCFVLVQTHLEYFMQFWAPQSNNGIRLLECVQGSNQDDEKFGKRMVWF